MIVFLVITGWVVLITTIGASAAVYKIITRAYSSPPMLPPSSLSDPYRSRSQLTPAPSTPKRYCIDCRFNVDLKCLACLKNGSLGDCSSINKNFDCEHFQKWRGTWQN